MYRCLHVSIYRCAIPPHDFSGKSNPPPPTPPPPRSIYLTQNTTACTITSYFYIVMITVLLRVLYIYIRHATGPFLLGITEHEHRHAPLLFIYYSTNQSAPRVHGRSSRVTAQVIEAERRGFLGFTWDLYYYINRRSTTMSVHRCEMRDET